MSGALLGTSGGFNAVGVTNALVPKEGPKAIPIVVPFATGILEFEIDLSLTISQKRIQIVQAVYIDNSEGSTVFSLTVQATQQVLRVPAGAQAYLPLLAGQEPRFVASRPSADNTTLLFLNVPVPALMWQAGSAGTVTADQGAPGTLPWPVAVENASGPIDSGNPLSVSVVSQENDTTPFSVAIGAAASESNTITSDGDSPIIVVGPAAWTPADLLLLGSLDNITFQPLYDVTGTALAFPFAANQTLQIAPALAPGWPYLRLRSVAAGAPATPVAQLASRTLVGILKRSV